MVFAALVLTLSI